MNKIVLIGGAPTAGKSYTARKIAESLKMPWISTDTIREQMRKLVRKEDYPLLFRFHGNPARMAVKILNNNTAKEMVVRQNEESMDVWKGVKAMIETDYTWDSFIIEGVAILPKLVSGLRLKDRSVKAIFLVDEDLERVRKTIYTKGLWNDADKYPDSVKEREVEWVAAFNEYIKREAKKYNFPVVSMGNRDDYLDEVKRIIGG